MKVSKISISNVLGVESLEFQPKESGVTVIQGRNREGKTSVLEALKAVVKGGHDATLLRKDSTEGNIVLVLDSGVELTKRVRSEDSKLSAKVGLGRMDSIKTWLDSIVDRETFDLMAFLESPAKDRVKTLLRAIPLNLPKERMDPLYAKAGITVGEWDAMKSQHPLEVLSVVDKRIYDTRTGVNRVAKEKTATAAQLRQAVPAVLSTVGEMKSVLAENRKAIDALTTQKNKSFAENVKLMGERIQVVEIDSAQLIRDKSDTIMVEIRKNENATINQVKEIEDQVTDLRRQQNKIEHESTQSRDVMKSNLASYMADIKQKKTQDIAAIQLECQSQASERNSVFEGQISELKTAVKVLESTMESAQKAEQTLEFATQAEFAAVKFQKESDELTAAMDELGSIRNDLVKDLPIPGMTVVDGEVYLNDTPFDRLSGAEKITLAFEVAKRCAGDLKLVVCDGIEALDAESFAVLERLAEESCFQVVVTKVSEGRLEIK